MIQIDDVLISDSVVTTHFLCDLKKCKGACCVEGESGAPLEDGELDILKKIYPKVSRFITPEGRETIKEKGLYVKDSKGKWKTPLMSDGACAYVCYENGIATCGIQKAWEAKYISFIKPISCHLYPIRVSRSRLGKEHVNYEEWEICNPACLLGKSVQMPVYRFVKDAIIRKWGKSFYKALDHAAASLLKNTP
ncbi:MAG: hypothetical protein KatS3mg031_1213 [Chitinophagales bacterium]|nr:MAG: hypothetical protein KatS3mg031_1213 [Chitinophagales bacterium]